MVRSCFSRVSRFSFRRLHGVRREIAPRLGRFGEIEGTDDLARLLAPDQLAQLTAAVDGNGDVGPLGLWELADDLRSTSCRG